MLNITSIQFLWLLAMIPHRLKSARAKAKLTQEKLGVLAGIDESTARSRVSQYESGTYSPNFDTMCHFARVLNVPECYFYIIDDAFAEQVLALYEVFRAPVK